MAVLLALSLQAAAAPLAKIEDIDFDLAKVDSAESTFDADARLSAACLDETSDEIVVCGRRRKQGDRLERLPANAFAEAPLKAETGLIGNLRVGAEAERSQVGSIPTNRAMVRLKLPF